MDTERYRRWLGHPSWHHQLRPQPCGDAEEAARLEFRIVVAFAPGEADLLAGVVSSLRNQTHPRWRAVLCPNSAEARHTMGLGERIRWQYREPRVTLARPSSETGSPASALNVGLAHAVGEPGPVGEPGRTPAGPVVLFALPATRFIPDALETVALRMTASDHPDLVYWDSDTIDDNGLRCHPRFLPGWSPEFLTSTNYIGPVLAMSNQATKDLGAITTAPGTDPIHDLLLAWAWPSSGRHAGETAHIPRILHSNLDLGPGPAPGGDPTALTVRRSLQRSDQDGAAVALGPLPFSARVVRAPQGPARASVIIPFRDQPRMLRRCVDSLLTSPGHDSFEVLLVDNDSREPETMALLERYGNHPKMSVVSVPGAFNWSSINNAAVARADGDVFVFVNNDIEARSPSWLRQIVAQALRPDIGAVGARLLYGDGSLQHAGVVIGLGLTTHVLRDLPGSDPGYGGMAVLCREVTAATGACLATSRGTFEALKGFDEELALGYNDIDYCLRAGQRGLRILYDPVVEMIHHESRSRGYSDERHEVARFFARWEKMVTQGDPYYNPNLSRFGQCVTVPQGDEEATWSEFLETFKAMVTT
ncbi:MAG: glycosyltransferase family 2 protein [Acidimicrobiales bacterium]